MTEQNKRRNPYSDVGLMIAVSIFIVMIVKCLLFDANWISLVWIALCVVYFFLSYKFDSEKKIIKHSTTAFLMLSVVIFGSIILLDQKPEPKMHAFEGRKIKNDSIAEEEFIQKKEPTFTEEKEVNKKDSNTTIINPDSTNTTTEGNAEAQSSADEAPSEQIKEEDQETPISN